MRLMVVVSLSTILLTGCASSPELAVVESPEPGRATGATELVAVGPVSAAKEISSKEIGHFYGGGARLVYGTHSGRLLEGMDWKFRLMVHDELANAGYRVIGEKYKMVSEKEIETPTGASLLIGGVIENVDYDTYSSVVELSTRTDVEVDWTVSDISMGKTVYEMKSTGRGEGPIDDTDAIVEAVRGSFRRVLSDPGFIEVLRK